MPYCFCSELFELVTPQGRPTSPPTATATAPADSQSHLYLAREEEEEEEVPTE